MKDVLIELIDNVQATGGLIKFSDGLTAPQADPTWTDLGATILKVADALEKEGVNMRLEIEEVDYSSEEAEENSSF